jgi:hypothetical protein
MVIEVREGHIQPPFGLVLRGIRGCERFQDFTKPRSVLSASKIPSKKLSSNELDGIRNVFSATADRRVLLFMALSFPQASFEIFPSVFPSCDLDRSVAG